MTFLFYHKPVSSSGKAGGGVEGAEELSICSCERGEFGRQGGDLPHPLPTALGDGEFVHEQTEQDGVLDRILDRKRVLDVGVEERELRGPPGVH